MDKLPDWIITWLWIKNPVLNRDNRQFMHARWIKDDSDKEVMLTHTIWMFPKLFPIMLLHQIHNCSTSQLSHPGWGSRFVSGYLGTTSVGNRLLEHNREAVIPAMCLAWVSALNFVPLSTSILRIGSVLSSDHDWLQLSFPLSTPLLPSLFFPIPFLSCHQLVFQEERTGERERKRRIPSAQGQGLNGRRHNLLTCTLLLDPWEASFTQE